MTNANRLNRAQNCHVMVVIQRKVDAGRLRCRGFDCIGSGLKGARAFRSTAPITRPTAVTSYTISHLVGKTKERSASTDARMGTFQNYAGWKQAEEQDRRGFSNTSRVRVTVAEVIEVFFAWLVWVDSQTLPRCADRHPVNQERHVLHHSCFIFFFTATATASHSITTYQLPIVSQPELASPS